MAMITTQLSSAQCFKLAAHCGVRIAQADSVLQVTPAQLVRMMQIAFAEGSDQHILTTKYREASNGAG